MLGGLNISEHLDEYEERQNTLQASSMDMNSGEPIQASQENSVDWHSGAPLHETPRKVGLDTSMSPITNDLASHTTKMQQNVILMETFQNQGNDRTTNSSHSENTTPNANIQIGNHSLYPAVTEGKMNADAVIFESTVNNTTSTIRQDL